MYVNSKITLKVCYIKHRITRTLSFQQVLQIGDVTLVQMTQLPTLIRCQNVDRLQGAAQHCRGQGCGKDEASCIRTDHVH